MECKEPDGLSVVWRLAGLACCLHGCPKQMHSMQEVSAPSSSTISLPSVDKGAHVKGFLSPLVAVGMVVSYAIDFLTQQCLVVRVLCAWLV
jgi:hypothetical protein